MAGSVQSQKVILTTRSNAKFEGILHSLDQGTGRIILKNVITEGVKIVGSLHFYTAELIDFQYIIETQEDNEIKTTLSKQSLLFFKNSLSRNMPHSDSDQLSLSHIFKEKNDKGGTESGKTDVIENQLIDEMSDEFFEAIKMIKSQSVIGIHFDGHQIGRHGTLTLIEVATQNMVFVFDILALKTDALTTGLQDIFESESIVKVIHDSRFVSDMLRHQFDITLKNIFDTQVASAFVFRARNRGDWPRHVDSLHSCLKKYLGLSDEQIFFKRVRENAKQTDENVFLQRPLPEKMLSAVCTNVYYLMKLRDVLLEKMLLEFNTAVNIYLNYFDLFGGQVNASNHGMHLLPVAFIDLQRYVDLVCPPHPEDKKTPLLKNTVSPISYPTEKGDNNSHVDGNTDLGVEAGDAQQKDETLDSAVKEVPSDSTLVDLEISSDAGVPYSVNEENVSSGSGYDNAAVDLEVSVCNQNTEKSMTLSPLEIDHEAKVGMSPLLCSVETSLAGKDFCCRLEDSGSPDGVNVEADTLQTSVLSDKQSKLELNIETEEHGKCSVQAELKREPASSVKSCDLDGLIRSGSVEELLGDSESSHNTNLLDLADTNDEIRMSDITDFTTKPVESTRLVEFNGFTKPAKPTLMEEVKFFDIVDLTLPAEPKLMEEARLMDLTDFTLPAEPKLMEEARLMDLADFTLPAEPKLMEEARLVDLTDFTLSAEPKLMEEVRLMDLADFTIPAEPKLMEEVRLVDIADLTIPAEPKLMEEARLVDIADLTIPAEPKLMEEVRLVDIADFTIPAEPKLMEKARLVDIADFTIPAEPKLMEKAILVDIADFTELVEPALIEEVDTYEPKANFVYQFSGLVSENDADDYFSILDDDS